MSAPPITKLKNKIAEKEAERIVKTLNLLPARAVCLRNQGMFSKTVRVELKDSRIVIVQFKDNEIDVTKVALARGCLGNVVPETFAVKSTVAAFAYVSEYIDGKMWCECNCTVEENCRIASSLAQLLLGCVFGTSPLSCAGLVDNYIVPRLRRILEIELKDVTYEPLKKKIRSLLEQCNGLKALPLALIHIDLNARNIFLDSFHEPNGIVDWEQAEICPLGFNVWCIRYLSVPIYNRKDCPAEKSAPMAAAFWKSLIAGLPAHLRSHAPAILVSAQIGFIFSNFVGYVGPPDDELPLTLERMEWLESTFNEAL
ncbi:uncharacterized protein FOMMEDRAFT_127752 [Fomitiporia mediterranea MF3/22]|uniref:uncharacterized protein n=1 Tax=Fomitiporia mediterranea (strain MF3/22) TaxID=694068 RepID=UPI0004407A00|nr:uncharacterized protein FOMMEDRAFT_127752 [Fomitiporia mediterranea MF3/22]EJD00267.1 hypothetical protein FOMMEDRAFT_127752 [Fomitiporia mediterranea MF3/22]